MTTAYTFEQLKEDVRKEAEALRVHATKEERERLDIEALDPARGDRCVYGLATGCCLSERAFELIYACAPTYFAGNTLSVMRPVNRYDGAQWSPIEAYITMPEARNENLIAYLRYETETLEL